MVGCRKQDYQIVFWFISDMKYVFGVVLAISVSIKYQTVNMSEIILENMMFQHNLQVKLKMNMKNLAKDLVKVNDSLLIFFSSLKNDFRT